MDIIIMSMGTGGTIILPIVIGEGIAEDFTDMVGEWDREGECMPRLPKGGVRR